MRLTVAGFLPPNYLLAGKTLVSLGLIGSYFIALCFAVTNGGWAGASDFNASNFKICLVYFSFLALLFLIRKTFTRSRVFYLIIITHLSWATLLSLLGKNFSLQAGLLVFCSMLGCGAFIQAFLLPNLKLGWISWPVFGNLAFVVVLHIFSFSKILNGTSVIIFVSFGLINLIRILKNLVINKRTYNDHQEVTFGYIATAYTLSFPFFIYSMAANSPDVLFDSVAFKAAIPRIWYLNNSIELLPQHTQSGTNGSAQYMLLAGNFFGSSSTGSFLQLLSLISIVLIVLSISRSIEIKKVVVLPLFLFICTPAMLWQTSGAYDDIWLSLISVSAIYVTIASGHERLVNSKRGLVASGIIISSLIITKFSLIFLGFGITLILLLKLIKYSSFARFKKVAILLMSILAGLSIPLGWRWITYGNPVWPLYNSIFKAPSLPATNEKYNMPFHQFNPADLITQPVLTFYKVGPWVEASAIGSYSFFLLLVYVSIFVGLRSKIPENKFIAIILFVSLTAWWIEFRYLRYLFPLVSISLLLIAKYEYSSNSSRRAHSFTLFFLSIFAIALIPVGNPATPSRIPFGVIFGDQSKSQFLDQNIPSFKVIKYLNKNAPFGSTIMVPNVELYQRLYLRKDLDILYGWEIPNLVIREIDYIAVYSHKEKDLENKYIDGYCTERNFSDVGILLKRKCERTVIR
jgi:hypothetical protein